MAAQRGWPLPARGGRPPRAAGPELHRCRPLRHRLRRQVPVRHDQAGLLPVAEPPERLAARAHPLLAVRPRLRAAPGHPDVLSRRSAVLPGPDLQLGARGGQGPADLPVRPRPDRAGVGPRLRLGHRPPRPRRHLLRAAGRPPVTAKLTPSQTVGPFLAIGLPWPDGPFVVPEGTAGAITLTGRVFDGAGDLVTDALVETWQAGPDGRFAHPDDPRGAAGPGFRGFGRCPTGPDGSYRIVTLKPGPLPSPDGGTEAPHLDVSVFARGLLDRVVTRVYFPDERQANEADPVLASIGDPAGAPVLVLGNSLGTTRELWDPQLDVLARRFRLLRYEHRGHGGSPAPPGPYAISDLGADVLALLDVFEVATAYYAGVSLGGMVGMWLAANAPGRLQALALCCTSACLKPAQLWVDRAAAVRSG